MKNELFNLNELLSEDDFGILDMKELMKVEGGMDSSVFLCENSSLCSGGGGITCSGHPAITCNGSSMI